MNWMSPISFLVTREQRSSRTSWNAYRSERIWQREWRWEKSLPRTAPSSIASAASWMEPGCVRRKEKSDRKVVGEGEGAYG